MIKNLAKKKRKKEDGPEPVANQTSVQRSEYGRRKVRFQNERERDLVVEHGNQQSWDTIRQCGVYLLFCFEGGGVWWISVVCCPFWRGRGLVVAWVGWGAGLGRISPSGRDGRTRQVLEKLQEANEDAERLGHRRFGRRQHQRPHRSTALDGKTKVQTRFFL